MEGEVINFEQFKKKKEEKQKEEKQRLFDDEKEKDRVAKNMSFDQIVLVYDTLSFYHIDRNSLLYKTAFAELNKKPRAEVGDIIDNVEEDAVRMKPEYFRAALDIILGDPEIG